MKLINISILFRTPGARSGVNSVAFNVIANDFGEAEEVAMKWAAAQSNNTREYLRINQMSLNGAAVLTKDNIDSFRLDGTEGY